MNISDIAKMAKVSKSAVSLALNDKPGISDATREKIMNIVRESGYRHKSMVDTDMVPVDNKHIRLLSLLENSDSLQYPTTSFFSGLIHSIEDQAKKYGYALVFSSITQENFEMEIKEIERAHPTAGLILLGTNLTHKEVQVLRSVQSNLLVIDNFMEYYDEHVVVMDNRMGAYQAVSYLYELGHRRIGYVQSKRRLGNFVQRREGFIKAIESFGLENFEPYELDSSDEDRVTRFGEVSELISSSRQTALFCESDYIAIDVIKALKQKKLKIPRDISVIGFDNVPESIIVSPELTTIDVFRNKMAEIAVENIVGIIEKGNGFNVKTLINTELVIRSSCRTI